MTCPYYKGVCYNKNVIKPIFTIRCGKVVHARQFSVYQFTTKEGAEGFASKICLTDNFRCLNCENQKEEDQ